MLDIESKLEKSKKKWEKKLKQKEEERDKAGKRALDFPNLMVPLILTTFTPAFLVLSIVGERTNAFITAVSFSTAWCFLGVISTWNLCHLDSKWFTHYGTKAIIKEEIPWKKGMILLYLLCCAGIVGIGLYLKSMMTFTVFMIAVAIGTIKLALHKDAILWDMPPARLLGYKKYKFIPKGGDNHTVRGKEYQCVARNMKNLEEDTPIEGTFIGLNWFLLRKS